ncbi:MAG: isopenicillin N synthase-like dioxygenase [Candidatus Poriferisodalaceae bacterium]
MTVTDADTGLIPVLDMRLPVAELGEQLRDALENVGFFFVVNHGIDWQHVEHMYARAAELHALPDEAKASFPMDGDHGGYLGLGGGTSYASEIAGEERRPNQNEAFFVHEGGYRLANRFPDLPGFREDVADYMGRVQDAAIRLLPALAASLDLEHDFFATSFDEPSVTLRMSHYPLMQYANNEWGLAPHTDSSIFTFLPANDVPGLEIRPAGHDWIEPPPIAEAFLVNSGDMLKRWTNHRFMSTAHRVRNRSEADRYAIPFFFGARDDALIEAVPTTVTPDRPARHEPITYGDYQRWFINRNYAGVTGEEAGAEAP